MLSLKKTKLFCDKNNKKSEKPQFKIRISSDVYRCCLHHALVSQSEEVMGILIGEKISNSNNDTIVDIKALRIVPRLDKRKDRVEISDEQMIQTTQMAEDLSKRLNIPNLRVVGWYHSHPHITVWPSHVDLRTQFNYQRLDEHFIGLIFSVFNVEKERNAHDYELVAFQAERDENMDLKQLTVAIEIASSNDKLNAHVAEELIRLSNVLSQEHAEAACKAFDDENSEENSLKSLRLNLALQSGYASVLEHVTLPTLQQLQTEAMDLSCLE